MKKTNPEKKLTLSKETLKRLQPKSGIRAGAPRTYSVCPATLHTCASFDRC